MELDRSTTIATLTPHRAGNGGCVGTAATPPPTRSGVRNQNKRRSVVTRSEVGDEPRPPQKCSARRTVVGGSGKHGGSAFVEVPANGAVSHTGLSNQFASGGSKSAHPQSRIHGTRRWPAELDREHAIAVGVHVHMADVSLTGPVNREAVNGSYEKSQVHKQARTSRPSTGRPCRSAAIAAHLHRDNSRSPIAPGESQHVQLSRRTDAS